MLRLGQPLRIHRGTWVPSDIALVMVVVQPKADPLSEVQRPRWLCLAFNEVSEPLKEGLSEQVVFIVLAAQYSKGLGFNRVTGSVLVLGSDFAVVVLWLYV